MTEDDLTQNERNTETKKDRTGRSQQWAIGWYLKVDRK